MKGFQKTVQLVSKIIKKVNDDKAFNLSAALAYYTVFSLAPLLFILIQLMGLLFDADEVRINIFEGLSELIGSAGAIQLETTLVNVGVMDATWYKSLFGVLILIFTATTIFATIQNGLNYIFRVKPKPKVGFLKFIKTRLLAFSLIIGIAFVLVVSLIMNGVITIFSESIIRTIPALEGVLLAINSFVAPFIITTLVFAIIFRFLPDARTSWNDLFLGSVVASLLFSLGRYAIGYYIGNSNIASVYDAAGSLMVIFVWMYLASFLFYLGAIFTVVYAEEMGSGIVPEQNTLRFIQKEIKVADEHEEVKVNGVKERLEDQQG